MKKNFYAYVGQNASCGEPNKKTGRMSCYGSVVLFSSQKERDVFVIDYYDPNGNKFAVGGGKKEMRSFCLGMSVLNFEEYLLHCDTP